MKQPVLGERLPQAVATVFLVCVVAGGLIGGGARVRELLVVAVVVVAVVLPLQRRISRHRLGATPNGLSVPWWLGVAVPLALFTWASFLYVGARAERPQWSYAGIGYLAAFYFALGVADHDVPLAGVLLVGVWLLGLGHAAAVNSKVVERLDSQGEGS